MPEGEGNGEAYGPAMMIILRLVNGNFPKTRVAVVADPWKAIDQFVEYHRLSRQDDKSKSPEVQEYKCRMAATGAHTPIIKTFAQDAKEPISGKAFADRPGWESLIEYLTKMKPAERKRTAVLVSHFDRYSRDVEEGLKTTRELE